ncbi:hypothetical protein [Paraherbaspirillum soli]|uniref:Tetratricopeptide repeat protein n=1 Tax=Paraherbaspirillum soli TaxID=631222 RepID=A0ABW0MDJ8_9BURK
MQKNCDDDTLKNLLAKIGQGSAADLHLIDSTLAQWPQDARLYFLRGSIRAGLQQYDAAIADMIASLTLNPNDIITRFQLGFLYLTCADAARAVATWRALEGLNAAHPIRLFVDGLRNLAEDRFAEAEASLKAGISSNQQWPEINRNMQLILAKIPPSGTGATQAADAEHQDNGHLLLSGYLTSKTTH